MGAMPTTKTKSQMWNDPAADRDDFDVPTRLVVDERTFERVVERMERPRPPTAAMLALFRK
jgi:hypothetical protein